MSRKKKAKKREVIPDQAYNSSLIAKLINGVMLDGKRSTSEKIVYRAMEEMKDKAKDDPLKICEKAVGNVKPKIETKSRRVGGATYQVPIEVPAKRADSLAIRWLIQYAKERPGKSMAIKLTAEFLDAFNNRGGAVKKKEDVHRMAEANRAFAHYKW
ncbi:MAG: 30S ribosomal protein S7 [Candidatus Aminicenantes bacterium]